MRNAFIFYINKKVDMNNDIRHGKKITFDIKRYSFLTFFSFCSIKALKPGSWTYRLGEFADEINEYELEKLEIITHTLF